MARREDAQFAGVPLILGGEDENRFREIEFAGNLLHPVVVQPLRFGKDSQLVSSEGLIGKDISGKKSVLHF